MLLVIFVYCTYVWKKIVLKVADFSTNSRIIWLRLVKRQYDRPTHSHKYFFAGISTARYCLSKSFSSPGVHSSRIGQFHRTDWTLECGAVRLVWKNIYSWNSVISLSGNYFKIPIRKSLSTRSSKADFYYSIIFQLVQLYLIERKFT